MFKLLARGRTARRLATAALARDLAYEEAADLAHSHATSTGHNAGEPFDTAAADGYTVSCSTYRCGYTATVTIGA
jgi:hypothetical protein